MLSNQVNIINDRYLIKQQLSHKAGRQTLLAEDTESQELVIIKILQFDSLFQWDDLKLFEREAKTLKNLDHPAIPKYLDYFEIDNEHIRGFALVQTYIDALSLAETIEQGRKFSELELIEMANKLLEILAYLHQQNPPIIHRDIKPSNILINNRTGNSIGELYLVDFGSVQTVASKAEGTITIVGSYGYIPLEQFGGQTVPASDLYSLGMTLIYLITGVHPAELTQINGRVEFKSNDLSSQFYRWLEKITNPNLDRRFDSAKSAQTSLISNDGDSGNLLHLKPRYSSVKLKRDRHKLEIFTPEIKNKSSETEIKSSGCLAYFIFSWVLVCFFGWGILIPSIVTCLIVMNLWNYTSLEQPYYQALIIERDRKIALGYYHQKPTKIEWEKYNIYHGKIDLIVYNPGYTFTSYLDNTGNRIKSGKVEIKPQLSLYHNYHKIAIDNGKQSQSELWWLGQEICDFLGLELQIIYPTPRVPLNSFF